MAATRHAYIKFYPSDWVAGTARMTRLQRSLYFDVCLYNWDYAKPMPKAEQALQFSDVDGWESVIQLLVDAGKLKRTQGSGLYSERALNAGRTASERWSNASAAGKDGAAKRWGNKAKSDANPNGNPNAEPEPEPEPESPPTPQGGEPDLFSDGPPDGGESPEENFGFALWWSEYPNKTGKAAAEKAFAKAIERLSGSANSKAAQLVFSLRAQKRVWRRKGVEGRYIPHGATWLNQSRWTDDEVVAEATRKIRPRPEPPPAELSPAEPAKGQGRPKLAPVGWTPGPDCPGCGVAEGVMHRPGCPVMAERADAQR